MNAISRVISRELIFIIPRLGLTLVCPVALTILKPWPKNDPQFSKLALIDRLGADRAVHLDSRGGLADQAVHPDGENPSNGRAPLMHRGAA